MTIFDTGKGATSTINMTNDAQLLLSPPMSGTYKGVSYFVDRSATSDLWLQSNSKLVMDGAFYGAKTTLRLETQANCNFKGQFIGRSLLTSSTCNFINRWNAATGVPTRTVSLAE